MTDTAVGTDLVDMVAGTVADCVVYTTDFAQLNFPLS